MEPDASLMPAPGLAAGWLSFFPRQKTVRQSPSSITGGQRRPAGIPGELRRRARASPPRRRVRGPGAGRRVRHLVSLRVAALAAGVARSMFLPRIKVLTAGFVVVTLATGGAGVLAVRAPVTDETGAHRGAPEERAAVRSDKTRRAVQALQADLNAPVPPGFASEFVLSLLYLDDA